MSLKLSGEKHNTTGEIMFSTFILDRAIEDKKKEREALRLRLLDKVLETLGGLARVIPILEAYVFGSVSRPFGYRENSDIDIAVIGLKDEDFFKAMAFLSEAIGVDVDVVQMEGHRLADTIKREGIKWTAKK